MLTTKGPNKQGFDILYDMKNKRKLPTVSIGIPENRWPIHSQQLTTSIADLSDFVKSNVEKYETDAIPAKSIYESLKNVTSESK